MNLSISTVWFGFAAILDLINSNSNFSNHFAELNVKVINF